MSVRLELSGEAIVKRGVLESRGTGVDLSGSVNLGVGVLKGFYPVSEPTGGARDGEEYGEHVGGEVHGGVDETGVEVNVGIEVAGDEVLVGEGDAFEFEGDVEERRFAGDLKDFVGDLLEDGGAGVVGLVDAMAKAKEFGFAGFDGFDEGGDVVERADEFEHAQNGLVRASVQASIQRRS